MPDLNEMDLLREYADSGSETAFTGLVQRHINLVYSVALRYTGNSPDAQDVTQAVFIILAQKAASLRQRTTLTGWLYETTRFTGIRQLRNKARQQAREQEAYMQSNLNDPNAENIWRQLAPILEDAMSRLNEKERTLLALRFYENKSGAETAALLGIQEWAAHKRATRALEKLRKFFTKRGIDSTTAVIAEQISANSVQAAPALLAKTATAVALAKGATASLSTLILVKGALKIMAWTKTKTAIVVGAVILLAGGTTFVAVKKIHAARPDAAGLSWQVFDDSHANEVLASTPPQATVVPTKFPNGGLVKGRKVWSWMDYPKPGRLIGMNCTPAEVIAYAMREDSPVRVMNATEVPTNGYDFIANLANGSEAALLNQMKQKLGLAGHFEMRARDALALRLKPGFSADALQATKIVGTGKASLQTVTMLDLAAALESLLHYPVVDTTGFTGHFSLMLRWDEKYKFADASVFNQLLSQIGLELVPTNMPIKVLVIDKAQ